MTILKSYWADLSFSVLFCSSKKNQFVFELLTNQKAGLKLDGFLLGYMVTSTNGYWLESNLMLEYQKNRFSLQFCPD